MADAGSKVLRGLLDVFLLESLEKSPKHGYALLREMADAFGTEPNRNRLYPLLGRMVQEELIVERSEPSGTRTLYALTDAGREALDGYRRLPTGFHDRLARIWGPPFERPASAREIRVGEGVAQHATAPTQAPAPAGVLVPTGAPYPCPDARVTTEKDPRSGALAIRLTGCPMGAYEYCSLCPVAKSVEGIRRLTFL